MKLQLIIFSLLSLLIAPNLFSQEATPKPKKVSPWTETWIIGINGSQAAYSNWSKGGVNSLALSGSSVFKLKYKGDIFANSFKLDIKYGQTRIDNSEIWKTDDIINLNNKIDYFLHDKHYSAFAEFDFKTQFDKGYNKDNTVVISNFFSPAYFQQSLGFSFQPITNFSAQSGLALKQTIVNDDNLAPNYGIKPGESLKSEGGVSVALKYSQEFIENVTYNGEFSTFSNLKKSFGSTDIDFKNELNGKINSFLSANIQFALLFDNDVTKKLQVKQVLSVGFNLNIF